MALKNSFIEKFTNPLTNELYDIFKDIENPQKININDINNIPYKMSMYEIDLGKISKLGIEGVNRSNLSTNFVCQITKGNIDFAGDEKGGKFTGKDYENASLCLIDYKGEIISVIKDETQGFEAGINIKDCIELDEKSEKKIDNGLINNYGQKIQDVLSSSGLPATKNDINKMVDEINEHIDTSITFKIIDEQNLSDTYVELKMDAFEINSQADIILEQYTKDKTDGIKSEADTPVIQAAFAKTEVAGIEKKISEAEEKKPFNPSNLTEAVDNDRIKAISEYKLELGNAREEINEVIKGTKEETYSKGLQDAIDRYNNSDRPKLKIEIKEDGLNVVRNERGMRKVDTNGDELHLGSNINSRQTFLAEICKAEYCDEDKIRDVFNEGVYETNPKPGIGEDTRTYEEKIHNDDSFCDFILRHDGEGFDDIKEFSHIDKDGENIATIEFQKDFKVLCEDIGNGLMTKMELDMIENNNDKPVVADVSAENNIISVSPKNDIDTIDDTQQRALHQDKFFEISDKITAQNNKYATVGASFTSTKIMEFERLIEARMAGMSLSDVSLLRNANGGKMSPEMVMELDRPVYIADCVCSFISVLHTNIFNEVAYRIIYNFFYGVEKIITETDSVDNNENSAIDNDKINIDNTTDDSTQNDLDSNIPDDILENMPGDIEISDDNISSDEKQLDMIESDSDNEKNSVNDALSEEKTSNNIEFNDNTLDQKNANITENDEAQRIDSSDIELINNNIDDTISSKNDHTTEDISKSEKDITSDDSEVVNNEASTEDDNIFSKSNNEEKMEDSDEKSIISKNDIDAEKDDTIAPEDSDEYETDDSDKTENSDIKNEDSSTKDAKESKKEIDSETKKDTNDALEKKSNDSTIQDVAEETLNNATEIRIEAEKDELANDISELVSVPPATYDDYLNVICDDKYMDLSSDDILSSLKEGFGKAIENGTDVDEIMNAMNIVVEDVLPLRSLPISYSEADTLCSYVVDKLGERSDADKAFAENYKPEEIEDINIPSTAETVINDAEESLMNDDLRTLDEIEKDTNDVTSDIINDIDRMTNDVDVQEKNNDVDNDIEFNYDNVDLQQQQENKIEDINADSDILDDIQNVDIAESEVILE